MGLALSLEPHKRAGVIVKVLKLSQSHDCAFQINFVFRFFTIDRGEFLLQMCVRMG